MNPANQLLERIEAARMWSHFHKDWLLQVRALIRAQLPKEFSVFVESEAVDVEETCELFHQYRLVIRRSPDNQVVAAAELLSPTTKGVFAELEKAKYLRKRDQYLDAGVNLLEIDALIGGDRVLPKAVSRLATFDRSVWSVCHDADRRRYRGWGWNNADAIPTVIWPIEPSRQVIVDLGEAFRQACEFNPWERLVSNAETVT